MFWPPSSRTLKYEFLPAVGTTFPLLLSMLFLASCGSALSRRGCSCYALLVSCLVDHPTLSLLTSRKYSSAPLWSCLSITPCVTLSWRSIKCLVANSSLVYCTLFTYCAWFAGLTVLDLRPLRLPAQVRSRCGVESPDLVQKSTDATMLHVCCFDFRAYAPPKLHEQSPAALRLLCSGSRSHGHVHHGQWAYLDADIHVLIDRSGASHL